jgi:hypothetical protein
VWLGSQAFFEATMFDQNIGAWNSAKMTAMYNVCALCRRLRVPWLGMRRFVANMPSAAADRGCGHAGFFHASLIRDYTCALSDITEYFSVLHRSNRRS